MDVDGPALLLFSLKGGLNASALLTIGLALHAGLGIVESSGRSRSLGTAAIAASVLLALTLARFGLVNAQLGGGLGAAFDASTFPWTWQALGPSSTTIAIGCAGVLLSAVVRISWVAAPAALIVSAGFGLTGHTAALENAGVAPVAAALHVLIAGFWIAAPLSLYPHSALMGETLLGRLGRFSRCAVFAVPLMFGLGLWLAWSLTGGLQGLVGSVYGRLLLFKLAVASLALGLGAINQRAITRMIVANPERGRRWLATTLRADAVLFTLAILIISAATTFTGPPSPS